MKEVILSRDKRKAIRQLRELGFRIEDGHTATIIHTPEGILFGRFTSAGRRADDAGMSLVREFRKWQQRTGRYASLPRTQAP